MRTPVGHAAVFCCAARVPSAVDLDYTPSNHMKCMYRYAAAMLGLMLVASSGALAPSAVAQSSWDTAPADDRTQYEAPRTPDPAGTGVPDWADSGAYTNDFGSGDFGSGSDGPVADGPQTNQGPGLPGDPEQVPVDGGIGLLLLAGAGYATRRLRGDTDTDETEAP